MRSEHVTLVAIAAALGFAACFDIGQGTSTTTVSVDSGGGTFCFDTGDASLRYADFDHDGYGDPDSVLTRCDAPSTWVTDATDCNDADGAIHPGGDDTCGDGIDQDCSGADADCPAE